jgi:hypothetical protein
MLDILSYLPQAIVVYHRLFIIGYCWLFYHKLLLVFLGYLPLAIVENFVIGYY